MYGYVLPPGWTVAKLRREVLNEKPWGEDPHGVNGIVTLIVKLVRARLGAAAHGDRSLFGRLKPPADFLTVFKMLGQDQPWLAGAGGNIWSVNRSGYSLEVLNFAAGLTPSGLNSVGRSQHVNQQTPSGVCLFDEFTDLMFDVGLPTTRAIGAYRREAEREVLPAPGSASGPLRSVLRDDCFKGQGAAGLTEILRDVVTSHDQVVALEEDPVKALSPEQWTRVLEVFVQAVLRKLKKRDAHASELEVRDSEPFRAHIREKFGATRANERVGAIRVVPVGNIGEATGHQESPVPDQLDVEDGIVTQEIADDADLTKQTRDLIPEVLAGFHADWSKDPTNPERNLPLDRRGRRRQRHRQAAQPSPTPVEPQEGNPEQRGFYAAATQVAAAAHERALSPTRAESWERCLVDEAEAFVTRNPECGFTPRELVQEAREAYVDAMLEAGWLVLEQRLQARAESEVEVQ